MDHSLVQLSETMNYAMQDHLRQIGRGGEI